MDFLKQLNIHGDHTISFAIGVAASLTAVTLVWLFKSVILPRLRSTKMHTLNLHKTKWNASRNGVHYAEFEFKQFGDRLLATAVTQSKRQFSYDGIIRSDMIALNWSEANMSNLNFGSMNLKLGSDASTMCGITNYVKRDAAKVTSDHVRLERIQPEAGSNVETA